uniref:Uncharacterized protein n=1 Tax=Anguilla anguilla TaxID=7936 RepID=A0A0E9VTQ6_ANGAN
MEGGGGRRSVGF